MQYHPFVDAIFLHRLLDDARSVVGHAFMLALPSLFRESNIIDKFDMLRQSIVWNFFKEGEREGEGGIFSPGMSIA